LFFSEYLRFKYENSEFWHRVCPFFVDGALRHMSYSQAKPPAGFRKGSERFTALKSTLAE
jgi:hypothetical protein